jgi:hypothetical protein
MLPAGSTASCQSFDFVLRATGFRVSVLELASCDILGDGDSATAKIRAEWSIKAVTTKLDILDFQTTCPDELKVHG